MSKKDKQQINNQKETLLKLLEVQNEAIESAMEVINTYLREIYAHNSSLMYILMKNLK